ncbi:alpha-galactosidase [Aquisediminimonas profunda]|uniref:alpha-galactosidase n=1 Tax=Aquisediminimonas profunda TaxID=1550733 RepID=UPI001C63803F|nr:alpha-galactosidase [Aquisediminimonas profunda]
MAKDLGMPVRPDIIRCDHSGTTIAFDLRRGDAEPFYIGDSLPQDENLMVLADLQRRGKRPAQPDCAPPRSLLPQGGWGYGLTPAVRLSRAGIAIDTCYTLQEASATRDCARFVHRDEDQGIVVETIWVLTQSGIVRSETSLRNIGKLPLEVIGLASLALPLPGWASDVNRYSGRWAGEMQQQRVAIRQGDIASTSYGGRPGFGGGNWIRIESSDAREDRGHAIAAHLAWSGDHYLFVERTVDSDANLLMGARLEPGEVRLAPGERWSAPAALFAVSGSGIGPTRHAFHRYALTQTIVPSAAMTQRKVHLNSWEALGFDLDLPKLLALADAAAAVGVERFVLDDGWFRGRRDDSSSLGDWEPDPEIFPDGLAPLIAHVHDRGMDFGLWVEPEMVSPHSDLYRENPDWCLHVPGQPRPTQRNQLVLDLTRSDVCEYLFERLDHLLANNSIAYLKWDHNRDLFPSAGKGYAQVLALYALLDRLRSAHPQVEIETCASGGGRVDFEILKRCARFWASDNNDALERLGINAGWFDFLPLRIVGNHVGPSPNPITGRRLSMDFRAKVAVFGHMGVEANPAEMGERERAILAAHVSLYKLWREVVHGGELRKIDLLAPGMFGWLAWAGDKGLALVAQTRLHAEFNAPAVRLTGLDPDSSYRIQLLQPLSRRSMAALGGPLASPDGMVLSGRFLCESGLLLPLLQPETAVLISVEQMQ